MKKLINMKKSIFLVGIISILLCGCNNTSSISTKEELVSFLEFIDTENTYIVKDEKYQLNIQVDDESFIDLNSNVTYFKYHFLDNYQKYNQEEILQDDYEVEFEYAKEYYKLVSSYETFEEKFTLNNHVYSLKKDYINDYQLSYFESNVASLDISYDSSDKAIYTFTFDNGEKNNISIEFINENINYFGVSDEDYRSFYDSHQILYNEFTNHLIQNEEFVLIITLEKCSGCYYSEPFYKEFTLEYPNLNFYVVEYDTMSNKEAEALHKTFASTYNNQDDKYKLNGLDEYPTYYLTPTAVKYKNGQSQNVFVGMKKGDPLFKEICLK